MDSRNEKQSEESVIPRQATAIAFCFLSRLEKDVLAMYSMDRLHAVSKWIAIPHLEISESASCYFFTWPLISLRRQMRALSNVLFIFLHARGEEIQKEEYNRKGIFFLISC